MEGFGKHASVPSTLALRYSMFLAGRLAQLDRALVSGTKGRGFNSRIARHFFNQGAP